MLLRVLIVLVLSLVLLRAPTWADFEDGTVAYNNGDYATAMREWRPLAEQGDASAQLRVGLLYAQGKGVPPDQKKAFTWIRLAADQGLHDAQYFLGLLYEHGKGIPQDFIQAHKWYNLAGVNGDEIADKDRDLLARRMTPAQIVEAQKLAREWKPGKK